MSGNNEYLITVSKRLCTGSTFLRMFLYFYRDVGMEEPNTQKLKFCRWRDSSMHALQGIQILHVLFSICTFV